MDKDTKTDNIKCDHCGGRLMKARSWVVTGFPYWLRPWGSTLKMSEVVVPYACLECGRIIYILRDLDQIKRDFSKLSEKEKEKAYSSI